ncbi:MAG: aminopeptidase P family protein [Eubacteriales bacterium]|nr:aminopeptidase P family protein [Eubacteriales bacterium]
MDNRILSLKSLLPDSSAALITSDVNRQYFSSFRSSAGAVLVTKNSASLLVDFRYFEAASKSASKNISVICFKKLFDSINEILTKENIQSLIIEEMDVTVSKLRQIKDAVSIDVIDDFGLSDKIADLRMIKSESEIDKIITAQKITEKSFLEVLNYVNSNVTERKLALELEYLMKQNGAEKVAFDIICVSGKNTSLPHGVPSDKTINEGDFITFDIGAVYDGYHSDMTRTVAYKSATDKMIEVYNTVLQAHKNAATKIIACNTCADVDNAARDYITQNGYGEYFGHTTGHGVGLEIHEKPTVYLTNNQVLKSGMIITNEPGIYLPDSFGVRIEDMYLVLDDGYKDLATIDKELIIL